LLFFVGLFCYTLGGFEFPLSADDRHMLSTNSILRQGRYRIIEHFSSVASHNIYDAYDNLLGPSQLRDPP